MAAGSNALMRKTIWPQNGRHAKQARLGWLPLKECYKSYSEIAFDQRICNIFAIIEQPDRLSEKCRQISDRHAAEPNYSLQLRVGTIWFPAITACRMRH